MLLGDFKVTQWEGAVFIKLDHHKRQTLTAFKLSFSLFHMQQRPRQFSVKHGMSFHSAHNKVPPPSPPTFFCSSIFKMVKGCHTFICKYIQGAYEVGGLSLKKIKCITIEKWVNSFTKPNFKIFCWGRKLQLPTFTIYSSEAFYSILHIFQMPSCDAGDSYCKKGVKLARFSAFRLQIHYLPISRDKVKGNILYKDTLCILAFGTQNIKCKNYCYDKNKVIKIRGL